MFKYLNRKRKKGQSTLEYAILIMIIIGALISIQNYIKRGVQGRLKSAADDIGDQYSVGNTNYISVTTTSSRTQDTFIAGATNSALLDDEVSTTYVSSNVLNTQAEWWSPAD